MPALWLPAPSNYGSCISIIWGVLLMWYSESGQQLRMQLKAKVMVYVHAYVPTEMSVAKVPEV